MLVYTSDKRIHQAEVAIPSELMPLILRVERLLPGNAWTSLRDLVGLEAERRVSTAALKAASDPLPTQEMSASKHIDGQSLMT